MTKLAAVDVTFDPTFSAGRPRVVLEWMTVRYPPGVGPRAYDVTPDGKRFLMINRRMTRLSRRASSSCRTGSKS